MPRPLTAPIIDEVCSAAELRRAREGERQAMIYPPPAEACLPPILHPVSRHILELFLKGWLPRGEFLRLFSLPNSDYITVSECIVRSLAS